MLHYVFLHSEVCSCEFILFSGCSSFPTGFDLLRLVELLITVGYVQALIHLVKAV